MLQVAGLRKAYGDQVAVQGVDLGVGAGEIVGLVGANGAGKTTTLQAVAGIIIPDSGRVTIGGHDLAMDPIAAKRQLGFVPDEPQLFEYLTVEEHLRFMGRLYHVPDVEGRLPGLLSSLELGDRRSSLPGELSRGMRQKLSLGCAFIHDPALLLLDEPLTGLDPLGIRQMKDAILSRAAAGTAVLLSSHLLGVVSELCSRLVILSRGRVVAEGSPASIAERHAAGGNLEDAVLGLLAG